MGVLVLEEGTQDGVPLQAPDATCFFVVKLLDSGGRFRVFEPKAGCWLGFVSVQLAALRADFEFISH